MTTEGVPLLDQAERLTLLFGEGYAAGEAERRVKLRTLGLMDFISDPDNPGFGTWRKTDAGKKYIEDFYGNK